MVADIDAPIRAYMLMLVIMLVAMIMIMVAMVMVVVVMLVLVVMLVVMVVMLMVVVVMLMAVVVVMLVVMVVVVVMLMIAVLVVMPAARHIFLIGIAHTKCPPLIETNKYCKISNYSAPIKNTIAAGFCQRNPGFFAGFSGTQPVVEKPRQKQWGMETIPH
jgi:hypothetical protein